MTSLFTRATTSASAAGLACARTPEGTSAASNGSAPRVRLRTMPVARLPLFMVCARLTYCHHDCSWNLRFRRLSRGLQAAAAEALAQVANLLHRSRDALLQPFLNRGVEIGMGNRRQLRFFEAFFGALRAAELGDADLPC